MIGNEPLRDHNLVKILKEQCKTFKIWRRGTDLESCCSKQICVLIFFVQSEFSHVLKNPLKIALNGHEFFHPEVHLFSSSLLLHLYVVSSFSLIEDCA